MKLQCRTAAGHRHVPLHRVGMPKRDGGCDRRLLLLPGAAAARRLPAGARRCATRPRSCSTKFVLGFDVWLINCLGCSIWIFVLLLAVARALRRCHVAIFCLHTKLSSHLRHFCLGCADIPPWWIWFCECLTPLCLCEPLPCACTDIPCTAPLHIPHCCASPVSGSPS